MVRRGFGGRKRPRRIQELILIPNALEPARGTPVCCGIHGGIDAANGGASKWGAVRGRQGRVLGGSGVGRGQVLGGVVERLAGGQVGR